MADADLLDGADEVGRFVECSKHFFSCASSADSLMSCHSQIRLKGLLRAPSALGAVFSETFEEQTLCACISPGFPILKHDRTDRFDTLPVVAVTM
ncbi:hypothetical protein Aduo_001297 [Ancylostoma duodenale]